MNQFIEAPLMARGSNLIRRGAVYYALITIPTDLQPAMGEKKQKWVSLRTKDYGEAKSRKAAVVDQWAGTFDDMRRRRDLTDDDMQAAVWDHYTAAVEAGDKERLSRPSQAEIDAATDKAMAEATRNGASNAGPIAMINAMADVEILASKAAWAGRRRTARLNRLRSDLASGDTRLIEPDADAFLAKHGFSVPKGSGRYRELCHKLMRADIEQLARYAERLGGDFTGKPADPIIAEPVSRPELPGDEAGAGIMHWFEKYERANPNDIRPESLKQARRDVQHFADFVGSRVRPSKITSEMVGAWHDLLIDYPVRATETSIFRGLSLQKIVVLNKDLEKPKPTLTRQTVRRYMGSLSGFCRWLAKRKVLHSNPVADMMPKKGQPTNPRDSFKDDALSALFNSPLFTTAKSDQWRDLDKPGNVEVRDHRYWIPWIMLYSGARPAEVAQLHVDDVRQEDGIWIMHITEDGGGGKRTKTKGSIRVVPIHSALIDLGLLRHVDAMRKAGHRQVFPEIEIPKTGQIAAQFSREFNRYLTKLGVKKGREIVTYSLRHTFIDRARKHFLDNVIAIVVGHETGLNKKTMTSGYGVEQQGNLKLRRDIVESVTFRLKTGVAVSP